MYPEWRGGYYYAARPKGDATAPLGLLYVSRWSSAEKASEFAELYARSLAQRYKKVEASGDAAVGKVAEDKVLAENSAADSVGKQTPDFKLDVLKGRHTWTTEEGAVVIDEQGDTVFVSESLDTATTETIEREVFSR